MKRKGKEKERGREREKKRKKRDTILEVGRQLLGRWVGTSMLDGPSSQWINPFFTHAQKSAGQCAAKMASGRSTHAPSLPLCL